MFYLTKFIIELQLTNYIKMQLFNLNLNLNFLFIIIIKINKIDQFKVLNLWLKENYIK